MAAEKRGTTFHRQPAFWSFLGGLTVVFRLTCPLWGASAGICVATATAADQGIAIGRAVNEVDRLRCPPATCYFDPRDGQNHLHGPVALLDGGTCLCD